MRYIFFGVALIIFSTIGLYWGYSIQDWTIASLSWVGLIIGALSTLFGFGKSASERVATPYREVSDHGHAEITALIQSMGVVAVADRKVRDEEINIIIDIHEKMLGIRVTHEEVLEILSEFGSDYNITKQLTQNRSKLSPTMKRTIIQCCQLVMVSDLEVVRPEEARIYEIGQALGFSREEVDTIAATASI